MRVSTIDQPSNGARLTLMVGTGSRDDTLSTLGTTHAMQAGAVLSGKQNTAFLTTQLLANYGASMNVTVDREHLKFEVTCHPTVVEDVVSHVLLPNVIGSEYPHWELKGICDRMRYQKAMLEKNPLYCLMEGVHQASFKGGMANPILAPDHMIGSHSTEMLVERHQNAFDINNMVLVGSGVSTPALSKCVGDTLDRLQPEAGCGMEREATVFAGRECHINKATDISHVALGFEGLTLGDDDNAALSVIQYALGVKGNVKYGSELSHGILNKAINDSGSSPVFSTSAANINYTDCGVFVVHLAADVVDIEEVSKSCANILKGVSENGLPCEVIEAAKMRLQSSLALSLEDSRVAVNDSAIDALHRSTKTDFSCMFDAISGVTEGDVKRVAAKVFSGKQSLATIGHTANMPSLDELLL